MPRFSNTILTSPIGMRDYIPQASILEEETETARDFLAAPLPRTFEEVYEEAWLFSSLIMETETISFRGISEFATAQWDNRWNVEEIGNRFVPVEGGWRAALATCISQHDKSDESQKIVRMLQAGPCVAQLLPPFESPIAGALVDVLPSILRPPLTEPMRIPGLLPGMYFDPYSSYDEWFDMRKSPDDPDQILFTTDAKQW